MRYQLYLQPYTNSVPIHENYLLSQRDNLLLSFPNKLLKVGKKMRGPTVPAPVPRPDQCLSSRMHLILFVES